MTTIKKLFLTADTHFLCEFCEQKKPKKELAYIYQDKKGDTVNVCRTCFNEKKEILYKR